MASRTLGPYGLRPVQSHNSNFDLKNLIKCIIKVVNVSKSQYYEFRHNIINLGNQNSKYSWRIRDLENPQTGTQFANSVLMYTSKNPCYAQATWDWMSQKTKQNKKSKNKQTNKQTNNWELRGLHEPSLQLQKDYR